MQLSKEGDVRVQMCSTDAEELFRSLDHSNRKNSRSVSVKECAEIVLNVRAARDDLLLRLNKDNMSIKHLERKPFEEDLMLWR